MHHSFGGVFQLRLRPEKSEGENGDGRTVGYPPEGGRSTWAAWIDLERSNRTLDVLEVKPAKLQCFIHERPLNLVVDSTGDDDASWIRIFLETSRDVDAIPKEIVSVSNHISYMNSGP